MSEERVKEVTEWDGRPMHALTEAQILGLYASAPQWHAIALGPLIPFTNGTRAKVSVEAIFRETREDAEALVWWHVQNSCALQGLAFDEEDWTITHLRLVNGS